MRLRAILAGAAVLLVAAACGGAQQPEAERAETQAASAAPSSPVVLVTRDFGGEVIGTAQAEADETVIGALEASFPIETSYGGTFVQAIDGIEGSAGRMVDWFYFVNGVEADVGGADYRLCTGDRAWWDYRSWNGLMSVGVVVGAWPEPFLHGYGSCDRPAVQADPPLADALRKAGATIVGSETRYRALVGSDEDLRRREPVWKKATDDPEGAGLTAWIEDGQVLVWDAAERRAVPVPGATAVISAVRAGLAAGDGALLVVAGLDDGAAQAAARQLVAHPKLVERRYAVCLDASGAPLCAGGLGRLDD